MRDTGSASTTFAGEPISLETLVECFHQLEKSAKFWSEEGGRRGYLEYIAQFLPR